MIIQIIYMISFSQVQKKDLPVLAKIYARAYNKEWDSWTHKTSQEIVEYRYKKNIKIKVIYDNKIVRYISLVLRI